jgi:hypothetical protein
MFIEMSPLNPSLLFAVGLALDLIHEDIKRKLEKEQEIGFWVEWLAWAILSAVYWTIPIIHRYVPSSTLDAGSEEIAISEKGSYRKLDTWVALALACCFVGVGFLWQYDQESYNWALVSRPRRPARTYG